MNNQQEQWRDIEGYEGRYQVSNMGRVRSNYGGRSRQWNELHPRIRPDGSTEVKLKLSGTTKSYSVARLVAMAFISGYRDGLMAHHKDENPQNNRWDNLEWRSIAYINGYGSRPARVSKALRGQPVIRKRAQSGEKAPADLPGEQWQVIEGYDYAYMVSNMGRVKTPSIYRRHHQIMKPQETIDGYASVTLKKCGKSVRRYVHQLVAMTFVPGYQPRMEVNHKDENTRNNRSDNLQWVSHSENINYGTRNTRCAEKRGFAVVQYDDYGKEINQYISIRAAASAIGNVKVERNIRLCLKGRRLHAGGYRWAYKEKEGNT